MIATFLLAAAAPAASPEAAPLATRPIAAPTVEGRPVLPADTEVTVAMDEAVTSRTARAGQAFRVTVARDVVVGDRIAIPRGSPGVGEVTWRTGRGAYGKSGKLAIAIRSVIAGGRTIPVSGAFRGAGEGATAATVGTVLIGGLLAGAFVTGRTASFEQGRELRTRTVETIALDADPAWIAPAVMAASAPVPAFAPRFPVRVAFSYGAPAPAYAPPAADDMERPSREQAFARRLARQGGVRGREPAQGWTITD